MEPTRIEQQRERQRDGERHELHQRDTNRNRYTTPMNLLLILVGQMWEHRYVSCNSV